MGNHEYCLGCGASNFHYGRTCQEAYPKEYKVRQAEMARRERRINLGIKAVPKAISMLNKLGFPAGVSGVSGDIVIYSFNLAEYDGRKMIPVLRRNTNRLGRK